MIEINSRTSTVKHDVSTYCTSEPRDNEWGQPPASQYVLFVFGTRMRGQPIAGVYLPSCSEREDLDALKSAQWVAKIYEEWKRDPSTARPYAEIRSELVAEGLLDE